jgi:hypothetical protein
MAISAAFAGKDLGPESRRSDEASEIVAITGSTGAVGDQTTYTCKHVHRNAKIIGGAFAIASAAETLAGTTLTIEARVALANTTVHVEVKGDI